MLRPDLAFPEISILALYFSRPKKSQWKNQTWAFFCLDCLDSWPQYRSAMMYAMLIGQVGIPTVLMIGKTKRAGLMLLRSQKKSLASQQILWGQHRTTILNKVTLINSENFCSYAVYSQILPTNVKITRENITEAWPNKFATQASHLGLIAAFALALDLAAVLAAAALGCSDFAGLPSLGPFGATGALDLPFVAGWFYFVTFLMMGHYKCYSHNSRWP